MTPRTRDDRNDELETQVEKRLNADLPALVTKQRGYLDVEALAQEMIDRHDLQATKREVVRAIRRFTTPRAIDADGALSLLSGARISTGHEVALIEWETNPDKPARFARVFDILPSGELPDIFPAKRVSWVVVPERVADEAVEALGVSEPRVRRGLTHIYVKLPEDGMEVQVAESMVLTALSLKGIERVRSARSLSDIKVLLPLEQAEPAAELIRGLGGSSRDGHDAEREQRPAE